MKVIVSVICSFWVLIVPVSGWAILLNQAELQPIANQDPEVAKEVLAEMKNEKNGIRQLVILERSEDG